MQPLTRCTIGFVTSLGELNMSHALACRCGTLQGVVSDPGRAVRAICYCKDCQAFAHFLGRAKETLNDAGGTQVIGVLPSCVTFTAGLPALACMRLTDKGLLRWYASCCNTPIANTLPRSKVSHVGLIAPGLLGAGASLDAFAPICAHVNSAGATRPVAADRLATVSVLLRYVGLFARTHFGGAYKLSPFFS